MSGPEIAFYVTRLAEIPSSPITGIGVLDDGTGAAECRRIGQEIQRLYGSEGMMEVCRAYRGVLDGETAAKIARAWIGIGEWKGQD